jgi:hypothetical protein
VRALAASVATLVGLVALLGLVGLGPGGDGHAGHHHHTTPAAPPLVDVDPATVSGVTIETRSTRTRLVRDPGGWRLTEPVDDRAASFEVEAFLRALVDTPMPRGRAARAPVPAALVTVTLDAARRERRLLLHRSGRGLVARVDGRPPRPASRALLRLLTPELEAWREQRIVPIRRQEIGGVTVRRDGVLRLRARRFADAPSRFVLDSPVRDEADPLAVAALVEALLDLRADRRLEGRDATSGDQAALEIAVDRISSDSPVRVRFGARRERFGKRRLASIEGRDGLFVVDTRPVERELSRPDDEWRAPLALETSAFEIEALTLRRGSAIVELDRGADGRWSVDGRHARALNALLDALARVPVRGLASAAETRGAEGSPPTLVRLERRGDAAPVELALGPVVRDGLALARRDGRPERLLVDARLLELSDPRVFQ